MTNNDISIDSFKIICRVCLKSTENMFLVTSYQIFTMIEECTSIYEIDNINLPQHICKICFDHLKTAYEFKMQYLSSIKFLKNLIEESKVLLNSTEITKVFKDELIEDVKHELDEQLPSPCDFKDEYIEQIPVNEHEIHIENNELIFNNFEIESKKSNNYKKRKIEYNCNQCDKKFQHKKTLRIHKLTHSNIKSFECKICSSTFKYSFTLTSHMKIKHSKDDNNKANIDFETPMKKGRPTKKRQQFHKHNDHICDVCGKKFQHRKNLRVHKISHSSLRPYECTICKSTFKYSFTLTTHMKIKHTQPDQRSICFVCGKSVIPNSLSYHLSTHSVEKPKFKCDICEKEYCQKSALRQHYEEKHTDCANQKFYCDICNKGYETKRTLQTHKLYIHNTTRKFSCHICEKNFSCPSSVRKHINAQHKDLRPHACTECTKAFHTKTLLDKHMVTHTGERPYSCSICGKSFGFKSVLSTHMKIHNK